MHAFLRVYVCAGCAKSKVFIIFALTFLPFLQLDYARCVWCLCWHYPHDTSINTVQHSGVNTPHLLKHCLMLSRPLRNHAKGDMGLYLFVMSGHSLGMRSIIPLLLWIRYWVHANAFLAPCKFRRLVLLASSRWLLFLHRMWAEHLADVVLQQVFVLMLELLFFTLSVFVGRFILLA